MFIFKECEDCGNKDYCDEFGKSAGLCQECIQYYKMLDKEHHENSDFDYSMNE